MILFSKKWWVNIILAGLAVAIGFKAYDAWSRKAVIPPDDAVEAAQPADTRISVVRRDPSADNYSLVVEKNLFVAEREEIVPSSPESDKKKAPEKKPEEKPSLTRAEERAVARLALVGVVLTGDRKTALIQGAKAKGRAKNWQWVVEGDEIEGLQVIEIQDEKVLLKSGDVDVEILLYDPDKSRKRPAPQRAAQPTVVSSEQPAPRTNVRKPAVNMPITATRGGSTRPARPVPRRTANPANP